MPILERRDFEPLSEATFADVASRGSKPAAGFSIRMTSGTSGNGPLIMVWESAYTGMGVYKDAKRFVVLHGLMNIRLGTVLNMKNIGSSDTQVLMLDPADVSPEVCTLLEDFMPDGVYSFPALVMSLVAGLSPDVRAGIRTLSFGGAGLTQMHQDFFKAQLPNADVRVVYIANEVGCMSDDGCGYLPRNHYHPKPTVTVDIRDTDEEGVGDLYITTRLTEHVVVQNYRIGDVGRWAARPCVCGRPMFEVLGRRGYDFIKLGSAILRQEECDRVAALCKDLFDDYQLEASSQAQGDTIVGALTMRVYRAGASFSESELEEVARRVSQLLFLSYGKTLADLVVLGTMAPLRVTTSTEPLVHGLKGVRLKQLTQ